MLFCTNLDYKYKKYSSYPQISRFLHFLKVIPAEGVAPLPIIEPGVGEVLPPTIPEESIIPPLITLFGGVIGLFAESESSSGDQVFSDAFMV